LPVFHGYDKVPSPNPYRDLHLTYLNSKSVPRKSSQPAAFGHAAFFEKSSLGQQTQQENYR